MTPSLRSSRRRAVQTSRPVLIEAMENRQLLSASPVQFKAITPKTINAGGSGTEVVVIHNLTAAPVTEQVTINLAPSLDGTTVAGTYSSAPFSQSETLKKHGSLSIKVPFTPSLTLPGGRYHTLDTVELGTQTITGTAPGLYIYNAPTTTPSLVGTFSGLIISYKSTSNGVGLFGSTTSTTIHDLTFRWDTTAQDLGSVTGTFDVGDQAGTGAMIGTELTNGTVAYTFSSALVNFTLTGKVTNTAKGEVISGLIKSTLVDNLFSSLNGHFKITAGTTF